jgi:hypothetical protein
MSFDNSLTDELTFRRSEQVASAAERLVAIETCIRSGDYTTGTLFEYDRAYQAYIRANTPDAKPTLFDKLRLIFVGR